MSIGDYSDPLEYGPPFVIPSCLWELSIVTQISVENSIFIGSNATGGQGDPLLRLPATLTALELYNCWLVNPKAPSATYKLTNWNAFFASKPLLNYLTLHNVQLEANLPPLIPVALANLVLTNNPKLTGTIPADLFSNYAVITDSDIYVVLSNNGLSGSIPSSLFSNLQHVAPATVDFSFNNLTGNIPSNLFTGVNWGGIRMDISFAGNGLTGSLPAQILGTNFWGVATAATSRISLNLASNRLSGVLPDDLLANGKPIGTLRLLLANNSFAGSIPNFVGNAASSVTIGNLQVDLGHNKLVGALDLPKIWPPASMKTKNLEVSFAANGLTGTLPTDLFALSMPDMRTISLDFSSNSLSGGIEPRMIEDAQFDAPITLKLYLANNQLTGPLTAELIGSARHVAGSFSLDLSSNALGATIPSDLLSLYAGDSTTHNTTDLNLVIAGCGFTGTLPSLSTSVDFLSLWLDNNSLSAIPTSSWSTYLTAGLQTAQQSLLLSVSHNKFTGELYLPNYANAQPRLTLNVYANNFSSLLIGATSPYLESLNVGMNAEMTGSLPAALFTGSSNLYTLIANYTSISGDFPNLSGLNVESLGELDLSSTKIDFCPSSLTAPWTAYLDLCELQNNNVTACINKYPILCQQSYAKRQTSPVSPSSPSTSSVPSSVPSSGPAAPTPSSASSWTPINTFLVVLVASLVFIGY